jgi:hypothetical protein
MEVNSILAILAISAAAVVTITTLVAYVSLNKQLNDLHLSLNSRLDALLSTTSALARAEGYRAGRESEGGPDGRN